MHRWYREDEPTTETAQEEKAKKIKGAKAVIKKKDIMIQANKQKKHTQVQTSHNSKLDSDTAQLKKLLKDNKHQVTSLRSPRLSRRLPRRC